MNPEDLYNNPAALAEYLEHCKAKARAEMKAAGVVCRHEGRSYVLGELEDRHLRSVIGPSVSATVRENFGDAGTTTIHHALTAPMAWVAADAMLHVIRGTAAARSRSDSVECNMPLAEFVMMMRHAVFLGQYVCADANAGDIRRGQDGKRAAKKGGLTSFGGDPEYQRTIYRAAWDRFLKMQETAPTSAAAAAKRLAAELPFRKRTANGDATSSSFSERFYRKVLAAEGDPEGAAAG